MSEQTPDQPIEEPTYTLAEARQILLEEQCAVQGHDVPVASSPPGTFLGSFSKARLDIGDVLTCNRCGCQWVKQ